MRPGRVAIMLVMIAAPVWAQPTTTTAPAPVTTQRFEDYRTYHEQRHALDAAALVEARRTIDFRLSEMNELRAQINTERGNFATRLAFDTWRQTMDDRLNKIEQAQASMQSANLTWLAALGVFFTVVQVALRFLPTAAGPVKK